MRLKLCTLTHPPHKRNMSSVKLSHSALKRELSLTLESHMGGKGEGNDEIGANAQAGRNEDSPSFALCT